MGVSGLNINEARIPTNEDLSVERNGNKKLDTHKQGWGFKAVSRGNEGRFPANIILDEEAAKLLDEQSGVSKSKKSPRGKSGIWNLGKGEDLIGRGHNDSGGASRFFYCAKASKSERNMGCERLPKRAMTDLDKIGGEKSNFKTGSGNKRDIYLHNNHPTVKPLKLMEYLCTLTKTPTGGIVLDPFLGSGTTAMAAKKTGRIYIGIEQDKDYCKIAEARISAVKVENKLPL